MRRDVEGVIRLLGVLLLERIKVVLMRPRLVLSRVL
jgi:hypothetical protein